MTYEEAWGEGPALAEAAVATQCLAEAQATRELHLVRSAFESLARFHEHRLAAGDVAPRALLLFRANVAAALPSVMDLVRRWIIDVSVESEGAREDEQFEICQNRSAMDFLLEDHADVPLVFESLAQDVPIIDRELRRMCEAFGPIGPIHAPRGLPASHWWWRCADAPPPRERMRPSRSPP